MLQADNGGIVLMVGDNVQWKESIQNDPIYEPTAYISKYLFGSIREKYSALSEYDAGIGSWESRSDLERVKNRLLVALSKGTVDGIFNITKIDGATVVTRHLEVLGFGAKIEANVELESIVQTQPFEGSPTKTIKVADWNVGTRHKSAAKFVSQQKDCLALVASEDHRISLFSWDKELNLVQQLTEFEVMVID